MRFLSFIDKDFNELFRIYENKLLSRRDKDKEVDIDDADAFIRKHTTNITQYYLVKFIIKNLLEPALKQLTAEQILRLANSSVIICEQVFKHPVLRKIATTIASVGKKAVRKDWGDEKTEKVIFMYLRKFRPELNILNDDELRAWIRRELDWIRENILGIKSVDVVVEELEDIFTGDKHERD